MSTNDRTDNGVIDWARISYFCLLCIAGSFIAYFGQPLIHGNTEASGIIVNVFSILAGFLVTILTILGEPNFALGRSWRSTAVNKDNYYNRLYRHKSLFILYLVVLASVFASSLLMHKFPDSIFTIWLERFYLGCAVIAFGLSLKLPGRLMDLQMSRFNELVEQRKQKNG